MSDHLSNYVYSGFVNEHHIVSQPVEDQDDEDFQVGGTTSSNYADLNVQAIQPRFYADLTTTIGQSTNYEEIPT